MCKNPSCLVAKKLKTEDHFFRFHHFFEKKLNNFLFFSKKNNILEELIMLQRLQYSFVNKGEEADEFANPTPHMSNQLLFSTDFPNFFQTLLNDKVFSLSSKKKRILIN